MSQKTESNVADKVMSAIKEPDLFVQETIAVARAGLDRYMADADAYVRAEPAKALATAVAAGVVLRILPVTRIVGTFARVTLALLKPAVLVYGGAKVWQKLREDTQVDSDANPASDPTGAEGKKTESAEGNGKDRSQSKRRR